MNRDRAVEYLKRKGKETTEENIGRVMREGKIYGDPKIQVFS